MTHHRPVPGSLRAPAPGWTTRADVVVVCRTGLGTLNHTELTVRALRDRGIEPAGLVLGSWPDEPDLAQRCNLEDLPRVTGVPLLAVVPAGAGSLDGDTFRDRALSWFVPDARQSPSRR